MANLRSNAQRTRRQIRPQRSKGELRRLLAVHAVGGHLQYATRDAFKEKSPQLRRAAPRIARPVTEVSTFLGRISAILGTGGTFGRDSTIRVRPATERTGEYPTESAFPKPWGRPAARYRR
jgi:hypothetical protein